MIIGKQERATQDGCIRMSPFVPQKRGPSSEKKEIISIVDIREIYVRTQTAAMSREKGLGQRARFCTRTAAHKRQTTPLCPPPPPPPPPQQAPQSSSIAVGIKPGNAQGCGTGAISNRQGKKEVAHTKSAKPEGRANLKYFKREKIQYEYE